LASVIHPIGVAQRNPGPLSGGRQHAPGPRGADGGNLGPPGRSCDHDGLRFDCPVPHGGYVWWYIDALSADGAHGLTLIAFIGSVFSPYYAWARRRGNSSPQNHCALNVALYGPRASRWAMTERGAARVAREQSVLAIGPSALEWIDDGMDVHIDEVCAPIPWRILGKIRLQPSALGERSYLMDAAGRHRWTPFAPCARIDVRLEEPALRWSGIAYFDSNCGAEPLEEAFRSWTWSRASVPGGAVVLYDVTARSAAQPAQAPACALALHFGQDASAQAIELPPLVRLPTTGWRVARRTRADLGYGARIVRTLEDAPFYSRSLLDTRLLGSSAPAIHESLDLDRFRARWVQCLLPFRMPRSLT
jgi:carotenoid 1,2-hydratase